MTDNMNNLIGRNIRLLEAGLPLNKYKNLEDQLKINGNTTVYNSYGFYVIHNRTKNIYLLDGGNNVGGFSLSTTINMFFLTNEGRGNPFMHQHFIEGDDIILKFHRYDPSIHSSFSDLKQQLQSQYEETAITYFDYLFNSKKQTSTNSQKSTGSYTQNERISQETFSKEEKSFIKRFIVEEGDTPLEIISHLLPFGMILISIIFLFISAITFGLDGGYSVQTHAFKNDFWNGLFHSFTWGNAKNLISGITNIILVTIAVIELLIINILFYKYENKRVKVFYSILLTIGILFFGICGYLESIFYWNDYYTQEIELILMYLISLMTRETLELTLNVFCGIGLICLIVAFILLYKSDQNKNIKLMVLAILITYIAAPVALIFIENIVLLPILVIVLIITVPILLMRTASARHSITSYSYRVSSSISANKKNDTFISSDTSIIDTPKSTKESPDSNMTEDLYYSKTPEKTNSSKKTKTIEPKIWDIRRKAQLWVETNAYGTKVIRAYAQSAFSTEYNDKISYSFIGEPTLYEFKKGELVITILGKRMTERDLHYK